MRVFQAFMPRRVPPPLRRIAGSPGKRAYAIGDVHGRLDLLDDLLGRIEAHDRSRPARETVVVLLGDLIDRGPDSRGVIQRLMGPLPDFARFYFVMGNHEEMFVRGLSGEPGVLASWLRFGGLECAQSYGIDPGLLIGQTPEVLEHVLLSHVPQSHIRFLSQFVESVRFGDYLLVHAGVRPGVRPEAQSARDMRWIRDEFLASTADFGCMVVHGHSITARIEERTNRIGIDTGAYDSGVLTALWIEDEQRGYLHTGTLDGGLQIA